MMKQLTILFFLVKLSLMSFAQPATVQFAKVKSVSPEVASFGKFIDAPAGSYTGVPDISIPITTVTCGSISFPISLSYHAGGIKVAEEASWVGLGWSLFAGGFITQSVIGKEDIEDNISDLDGFDDFEARFLTSVPNGRSEVGDSFWQCSSAVENDPAEVIGATLIGKGEPDIYTFSFLGKSGKFYLDRVTKKPVILNYSEPMDIDRPGGGGIAPQWTITTRDGVKYIFGVTSTSSNNIDNLVTSRTWYLTRIETPDRSIIDLEYSQGYSEGISLLEDYSTYHRAFPELHKKITVVEYNNQKYLAAIVTRSERIELVPEDRSDIQGITYPDGTYSAKRLKEILVKDKATGVIKSGFSFGYEYFGYSTAGNEFHNYGVEGHFGKRLKLRSVTEFGYNESSVRVYNRPYEFSYEEGVTMPMKSSYATDYWGYYNGKTANTTFLPDLLPLYYGGASWQLIPGALVNGPHKANRGPSGTHMSAYLLKEVKLPTGGRKAYSYAPHTFSNFQFYDASQISNSDVAIIFEDKNTVFESAKKLEPFNQTTSVTFEIEFNRGNPAQGLIFDDMLGASAQLIKIGTGGSSPTVLRTWIMTNDMPTRTQFNQNGYLRIYEDIVLTPEPGYDYRILASLPDAFGAQNTSTKTAAAKCTARYRSFGVTGSQQSYGGGMRISAVEFYDENNALQYKKTYEYQNGILVSPPIFLSNYSFTDKTYQCTPPPEIGTPTSMQISTATGVRWTCSAATNISLTLSANSNFVGYSQVTELESNPAVNSKIKREFYNTQNVYTPGFPEVPEYRNGQLLKETYLTPTNTEVKSIEYKYKKLAAFDKLTPGYFTRDSYTGPNVCDPCGLGTAPTINPFKYSPRFNLMVYPIKSEYHVLDSLIERHRSGSATLTVKKNFGYASNGLLAEENTINSENVILQRQLKYPADFVEPYPFPVIGSLKNEYYSPVIEEQHYRAGNLLYKTYNEYVAPGVSYFLHYSAVRNAASADINFQRINFYNEYLQPLEVTDDKGDRRVYLYGNKGAALVAEISGISYATVTGLVNVTTIENATDPTTLKSQLMNLYSAAGAVVTLHVYNSKWLLTESVDPNQRSTYYQYDPLNRLVGVRDHDQNLLKIYTYHLKDQ